MAAPALDGSRTYFIRRFDREGGRKIAIENFAQLAGKTRETKHDSSMEQVARIVDAYCTFPRVEPVKLFRLTLFNFLVGNEDMHLKNFSLLRRDDTVQLSPAYDLVNTTVVPGGRYGGDRAPDRRQEAQPLPAASCGLFRRRAPRHSGTGRAR